MGIITTKQKGFTIVELAVVIVVISLLATIIYAAYNGVQGRARETRMNAEAYTLREAIEAARVRTHKRLMEITGSPWTGGSCLFQNPGGSPQVPIPDGTDFSKKTAMTQKCWDDYTAALQKISDASGIDVTGFLDPLGRPYYIDENDTSGQCNYDSIVWLKYPYTGGYNQDWSKQELKIPTYDPACYS